MDMDAIALEELIIDLKRKHYTVFATMIYGELFLWRPLSRIEFDIISKSSNHDKMLREEMICQTAVLYPKVNFTIYKAGIPTVLTPQIVEESGFGTVEKTHAYLHRTRMGVLDNFTAQAEIVIAAAFPNYTFEIMKNWNIEQLLDMVARAEWKLNVIDGKDFAFQIDKEEVDEDEEPKTPEEIIEEEKESVRELVQDIITNGGDPILELNEYFSIKTKKSYIEFPFIMGFNWDREDVLDGIRKEHKSISNK